MSSISGVSPSVTTQTQSTTSVNQTTSTTSSTTLYLDLGLADLSRDTTGLTKPKTPSDSSTLIAEILALSEELQEKLKEARIQTASGGVGAALAVVMGQLQEMIGNSQTVEGWKKRLAELAEQKKEAQGVVDQYGSAVDNAQQIVDEYNGPTGHASRYTKATTDAKNAWDYYDSIKNNKDIPDSTKNAAWQDANSKQSIVNNFYTTNNSYYRDYLNASQILSAHGDDVKNARGTIEDIEISDQNSPKYVKGEKHAENQRKTNQDLFEANTQFLMATITALSAAAAGKALGDVVVDAATEALLQEFADRMAEISLKANALANVDWSGESKTIATDTDAEATAPARVVAAAFGLLAALRDMLDSIVAIAKLDTHHEPGTEEQPSGRFHLAV